MSEQDWQGQCFICYGSHWQDCKCLGGNDSTNGLSQAEYDTECHVCSGALSTQAIKKGEYVHEDCVRKLSTTWK